VTKVSTTKNYRVFTREASAHGPEFKGLVAYTSAPEGLSVRFSSGKSRYASTRRVEEILDSQFRRLDRVFRILK
jgi:hypothetical protein